MKRRSPGLSRHRPNPAGLLIVPEEQRRVRPSIMLGDLAAETGMSTATIRRLIEKGELQGYYAGRSIAIFVDSVEEYQERHRVSVKTPALGREKKPKESKVNSARHQASVAFLRRVGIL